MKRADDARRAGNLPLFNAAWMAADRNLSRVHTILGNIDEDISTGKNEMLDRRPNASAKREGT